MAGFLFHVMRTFRWLIVPALKLMSALFCLFMLIALFADNPKVSGTEKVILWFVFAVGFGSLSWYYDALMKKLSPVKQSNQDWS